jgi:hypothetical protein
VSESFVSTIVWEGGDLPLMESVALWRTETGHVLRGSVVGALDGVGFSARYRVVCSAEWLTRNVWVELTCPPVVREVRIAVDGDLRWRVDGVERPDLAGRSDVDIQITPSTNTLPIRRLSLAVGQRADVSAVWVRFPQLDVTLLEQSYRRVGEGTYEYRAGDFHAELEVDEHGLVERYGSFWRRLPP